jgi:tetratricopeptide (TPR) repeat protein
MPDDFLTQGIVAVKAGNIQQARQLLDKAIRQNPNDERGWGWFYNVSANDEEKLRCLREILRINPNSESAKQKYNKLVGLSFQSPFVIPSTIKNDSISRHQIYFLIVFALIYILALSVVGVKIWPDFSIIVFPPTEIPIVPALNIETSISATSPIIAATPIYYSAPTEQSTPTTRVKLPTWTPIPIRTPFPSFTAVPSKTAISTLNRATTQVYSAPVYLTQVYVIPVYPTQVYVKPDCSAQYAYIESLHHYYLDHINSSYDSSVSYYESLIAQTAADRDALGYARLERDIDRVNANRDAAINTENSRYEADLANLDAQCQ